MSISKRFLLTFIGCFVLTVFSATGSSDELVEFENGEIADAEDINNNFEHLNERLDALDQTLQNLIDTVAELADRIAALESTSSFDIVFDGARQWRRATVRGPTNRRDDDLSRNRRSASLRGHQYRQTLLGMDRRLWT